MSIKYMLTDLYCKYLTPLIDSIVSRYKCTSLAEFVVLVYLGIHITDDDLLESETTGGTLVTNCYLLLIVHCAGLNSV